MPLYAYTCTACGHNFDIHQSFTDDSLTVCPECAGLLRKVFSPVGVVFKGSGFYRTDNKAASASKVPASPKVDAPAKESAPAAPSSAPASSTSSASSSSASSASAAPAAAK